MNFISYQVPKSKGTPKKTKNANSKSNNVSDHLQSDPQAETIVEEESTIPTKTTWQQLTQLKIFENEIQNNNASGNNIKQETPIDDVMQEGEEEDYARDENGEPAIPEFPRAFDVEEFCNLIIEKSQQPASDWTKTVSTGVLLYLNDPNSKKIQYPPYLPVHSCFLVCAQLLEQLESTSEEGKEEADTANSPPSTKQLDLHYKVTEVIRILQNVGTPQSSLLPFSPASRESLVRNCLRILQNTFNSSCSDEMETEDSTELEENKQKVHNVLWNASEVLNYVLREELKLYTKFCNNHENQAATNTVNKQAPTLFPLLWSPLLTEPTTSALLVSFLTRAIHNTLNDSGHIQQDAFLNQDDKSNKKTVWHVLCSLATLFFHICFCDEFVNLLLLDPQAPHLFHALLTLLQRLGDNHDETSSHIKYQMLRILTVLCEKEEPYFLDHFIKMPFSSNITPLVIKESSKIVKMIHLAGGAEIAEKEQLASIKEALRVLELLSYDSNFVTSATEHGTLFLLEFLSTNSYQFVSYLQSEHKYQKYICTLVFRVIANLHCFNPLVSPANHQGKLVETIFNHLSTIMTETENRELVQQKQLSVPVIACNLFYLFQRVTFQFSYTMQEHTLWLDFLSLIEERLNIKYPVITVQTTDTSLPVSQQYDSPAPAKRGRQPKGSSTPQVPESELKSNTLRGLYVSLGRVSDPVAIKNLVKYHGGNVLEYVSKTVTHVLCSPDQESLTASSSKIQSAASKQIPVVSENFIIDSVDAGKILPEKDYLVINQAYVRRTLNR